MSTPLPLRGNLTGRGVVLYRPLEDHPAETDG
jgi:hypothetical protein